jgi:archaellin
MRLKRKSTAQWILPTFNAMLVGLLIALLTMSSAFTSPDPTTVSTQPQRDPLLDLPNASAGGGALELRGSIMALSEDRAISKLVFTLVNLSKESLRLDDGSLVVGYRDLNQHVDELAWTWQFQGNHDPGNLLKAGESIQMIIPLTEGLLHQLGPNTSFAIEIVSASGSMLTIQRTTPAQLDPIIDLS